MRPFSPRMFPDLATLRPVAIATSPGGAAEERLGPPSPPTPCRVRLTRPLDRRAALGEVSDAYAHVAFPADPGVKLGDRVSARGVDLRALSPAQPRDPDGHLWVVPCDAAT